MKETQLIVIVFLILGIFVVYFFSQSTLFQEETNIQNDISLLQPINEDIPEANLGSNQSNSIPIQPIIVEEPVEEPALNENISIVNQVNVEELPAIESIPKMFTCSKSNFSPHVNDYIIYDIIGLEKLSVVFGETYKNEVNITLTVTNINSTWFIADLDSRSIIFGRDDVITGSVPLFWLPMHYNMGDTITNLGDIELKITDEDSMLFNNTKIDTIIVTGTAIVDGPNNQTESFVKSYYEKNTGILLQITEQSTTYEDGDVVEQQSINIITVIETNINFDEYSLESITREMYVEPGSFVIYEHDNFYWKIQMSDMVDNIVNITESRSFSGDNWEIMRWRIVDLGCLIIKDAHTTSFDNNFEKTSNLFGKSYEFIIRTDVLVGDYIFPAYENIGLGPEILAFKIIGFSEFEQNGIIIDVIIAESVGDGGIVRRYFDMTTGILVLEELEYDGIIRPIIRMQETSFIA